MASRQCWFPGSCTSFKELSEPWSRNFSLSERLLRRKWTDEEARILIDSRNAGDTAAQTSLLLRGRSVVAIATRYSKLVRLGIVDSAHGHQKWTPEDTERIMAAKARGMTVAAVRDLFPPEAENQSQHDTLSCLDFHLPTLEENKSWTDIARSLPGRSGAALYQ